MPAPKGFQMTVLVGVIAILIVSMVDMFVGFLPFQSLGKAFLFGALPILLLFIELVSIGRSEAT